MLEEVAKNVKSHLESDSGGLAAELDVVETYWSNRGDALSLPDVETWELGGDPDILDYDRDMLPVLVCMAQDQGPSGEHESRGRTLADQADQWGYGEAQALATVLWWIAADDAETAAKYGWRYAKAIMAVLRSHENLGDGIHLMRYVPRTRVDPPRVEYPETGDPYYTVFGQMEFAVRVRHS